MEAREQQLAYVPMIIPDMKFDSGELNSMPLIRSIDKSVRGLSDGLANFRSEVCGELREIHKTMDDQGKDIKTLSEKTEKIGLLEEKINDTQKSVAALQVAVEHIDKRIDDTKSSQDKWLQILGFLVVVVPIAVAVVEAFVKK